jgi:hypothetical protein
MTREEALSKVKGYLTDLLPIEEYDEAEEILKVLGQEIPEGATNGDMIKALFPDIDIDASVSGCDDCDDVVDVYNLGIYCQTFDTEWWNAPYKKGDKE